MRGVLKLSVSVLGEEVLEPKLGVDGKGILAGVI